MHIVSTNFAKTLVSKNKYNFKLWRHRYRTPNSNDHNKPLNEHPPPREIFCARHCLQESWSMVERTYQMTDMEINPWPKRLTLFHRVANISKSWISLQQFNSFASMLTFASTKFSQHDRCCLDQPTGRVCPGPWCVDRRVETYVWRSFRSCT